MDTQPSDKQLAKLLAAFHVSHHWPNLKRRGITTLRTLSALSDRDIGTLLELDAARVEKLRNVLRKVAEATRQRRSQASMASSTSSNPRTLTLQQTPTHEYKRGSNGNVSNTNSNANSYSTSTTSSTHHSSQQHPQQQHQQQRKPSRVLQLQPTPGFNSRSSVRGQEIAQRLRQQQQKDIKASNRPPRRPLVQPIEVDVIPVVVKTGTAHKLGAKVKSWQLRFFTLRNDGTLTYSKPNALNSSKGVIPVHEATAINGPGDCNWLKHDKVPKHATSLNRFEIVTAERTYKLFCETATEAEDWFSALKKVHAYVQRHSKPRTISNPNSVESGRGYQVMLAEIEAANNFLHT